MLVAMVRRWLDSSSEASCGVTLRMGDSEEMRPQVSRPARYCERADHPSQEGVQYAARGHRCGR